MRRRSDGACCPRFSADRNGVLMPTLTYNEGCAIDVIRRQARYGDPVPTHVVCDYLRDRGISYDATARALRGLVNLGVARKPTRGFYLPVAAQQTGEPR